MLAAFPRLQGRLALHYQPPQQTAPPHLPLSLRSRAPQGTAVAAGSTGALLSAVRHVVNVTASAAMVGGIVGGVGGAVLLVGGVLAAVKLHSARQPAAGVAPAAFPAEMSQPTSPLSPNTVAAHPFLPAAHPTPYSAAHA